MSRFTREVALWGAVAALAALPRLLNLHPPLANAEAAPALLALAAARGEVVAFANPLFGLLQALAFAILGASDASARLIPALAGTAVCLAPALLRHELGRWRALIFGALLALSPTLWHVSRQADGAMLAWALAFGAYCAWRGRRAVVGGLLFGALLACGADAVLPAVIAVAAAAAAAAAAGQGAEAGALRRFALAAVVAFGVAATGALLRPSGLGDAFNGLAAWLQAAFGPAALSFGRLLAGFALYDPLLVLGAVAGATLLARAKDVARHELAWATWIGIGLLAAALLPGRSAASFAPVAIGCAAYAAHALARLLESWMQRASLAREGVIAGFATVLLIYAGLGLWQYAAQGQVTWLYPILIAALLILAMIAAGGLGLDFGAGVRGTAAAAVASLLLWSLGAGLRLTHVQPDNPAEPYRAEVVGPGLSALVETIREAGRRSAGEPGGLGMQVADSAPPALRWALRDQRNATYAAQPGAAPAAQEDVTAPAARPPGAVLTPEPMQPAPGARYIGQAYELLTRAPLPDVGCALGPGAGPTCQPLARWLTLREPSNAQGERWLFWLRDDVAIETSGG